MRISVKARQKPWEWHQWYAWYPVRIPSSVYEDGVWVWGEKSGDACPRNTTTAHLKNLSNVLHRLLRRATRALQRYL